MKIIHVGGNNAFTCTCPFPFLSRFVVLKPRFRILQTESLRTTFQITVNVVLRKPEFFQHDLVNIIVYCSPFPKTVHPVVSKNCYQLHESIVPNTSKYNLRSSGAVYLELSWELSLFFQTYAQGLLYKCNYRCL